MGRREQEDILTKAQSDNDSLLTSSHGPIPPIYYKQAQSVCGLQRVARGRVSVRELAVWSAVSRSLDQETMVDEWGSGLVISI